MVVAERLHDSVKPEIRPLAANRAWRPYRSVGHFKIVWNSKYDHGPIRDLLFRADWRINIQSRKAVLKMADAGYHVAANLFCMWAVKAPIGRVGEVLVEFQYQQLFTGLPSPINYWISHGDIVIHASLGSLHRTFVYE